MKKNNQMPKAYKPQDPPAAEEIAQIADSGGDIARFFTRAGRMMPPIQPTTEEKDDGQED